MPRNDELRAKRYILLDDVKALIGRGVAIVLVTPSSRSDVTLDFALAPRPRET